MLKNLQLKITEAISEKTFHDHLGHCNPRFNMFIPEKQAAFLTRNRRKLGAAKLVGSNKSLAFLESKTDISANGSMRAHRLNEPLPRAESHKLSKNGEAKNNGTEDPSA